MSSEPLENDAPDVPWWLELAAQIPVAVVASVGVVGLGAAILGRYSTALALGAGLPIAAGAVAALQRGHSRPSASRNATLGAAAAVVLCVAYMLFAGATPSQNVLLSRDPGSYLDTGRWLARDGSLEVDAEGRAFDGVDGLQFSSAAVYQTTPGDVEFQFNHLSSVLLAAAFDIGGYRLMFRVPAIASACALLVIYIVTARATKRPFTSLLAPGLFALSMPLLYVSRNTYSEPAALLLLWGAVMVLSRLHVRPRAVDGIVGGAVLGAMICARVDALLFAAVMLCLAALSLAASHGRPQRVERLRAWGAAVLALAAVSTIGIIDLVARTGNYAQDLTPQLTLLRQALAASAVLSVIGVALWWSVPPLAAWCNRRRALAANLAAGGVIIGFLIGWLVRPIVQTVYSDQVFEAVTNIQKREGLPINGSRIYSEESLIWMSWYLGIPALGAAIIGLGISTWRAIRSRTTPEALAVLALGGAAGVLYLWNPSITPDQLWATRRFVPAVLPALAIMATITVGLIIAWFHSLDRLSVPLRRGASAVLVLVFVIPPFLTTWPLRWQRAQTGYLQPIMEACDEMPADAAVVVLGGFAGATLPQTLRSWCGVPVAAQGTGLTADNLRAVADEVAANGYSLHLIATGIRDLDTFVPIAGSQPVSTSAAADPWQAESTLDRPPSDYVPADRVIPIPRPFALHVLDASGA